MNILDIQDPSFLKTCSLEQLQDLSKDIRTFLLESVSKTGGHLSSNLGVVELTIALHFVFDAPQDKILFDVGHQCYVHKILTGRAKQMASLRQYGGISGFQKRRESIYDCFEAGHSSTALSSAAGMAVARDLNKEDYYIVPVVGDAAMMSGLSLEALNQIGFTKKKIIIVFNDNNMSINSNVGALTKAFAKLRNSSKYNELKLNVKDSLKALQNGESIIKSIRNFKKGVKNKIIDSGIFKEFDIDYLGPIDGHNFSELIRAFEAAKTKDGPVVVHCVTKKGKGYSYTENDREGIWHGVGKFDISTGTFLSKKQEGFESNSKIVADTLECIMKENEDVVAITPAMITGSKLNHCFKEFPDRCFDVGIAEDYAVSFASGLALNGKLPFLSIYSSFLQRAYDQLNQEISRMDLPIVMGIDRAGLVGDDGETHHGVYDISFLRSLPNAIVAQGKNSKELQDLLYTGFSSHHPYFVRYPRGNSEFVKVDHFDCLKIGSWEYIQKCHRSNIAILTYGEDVYKVLDACKEHNLSYNIINCRYLKPIDEDLLIELGKNKMKIFVYTSDIIKGGLADEVLECLNKNHLHNDVYIMGIDDIFVKHGDVEKLKKSIHLDISSLLKLIEKVK